jgi:hypothetical protein
MKEVVLLVLTVLFTGCVSSTFDLSLRSPYDRTVGREPYLQREVLVCRIKPKLNREYIVMRIYSPATDLHVLFERSDLLASFYEKDVCEGEPMSVPIGTPLKIDKVIGHTSLGGGEILVLGSIVIPGFQTRVPFQYTWDLAGTNSFTLPRAPWEDDSVPAERHVGYGGLHLEAAGK